MKTTKKEQDSNTRLVNDKINKWKTKERIIEKNERDLETTAINILKQRHENN